MQELIGNNGSFINVPRIPANLSTAAEVALLIPDGFEDILKVQIKSDEIHLTLLHDEYKDNVIIIPSVLYNPIKNHVEFPRFLIERSIFQKKIIDYFTEDFEDRYVFNQNELLYIVLQHRLVQLSGVTRAYSSLLRRDISAVKSFVQYVPSVAYNAVQKNKNSYIIMGVFNEENGEFKNKTLGDMIHYKSYLPSTEGWYKLKDQLQIQCSSESGASKVGKLILYPYSKGSLYRSIGHSVYFNEDLGIYMMKSLFKSAQNITARNKTHVTANAYELYDFIPSSVYAQDWQYNSEKYPDLDNPVLEGYEPKDRCYQRAVVVIRPMDEDTQQYLFGEVEANQNFYDNYVWEDRTVIDNFDKFAIPKNGTIIYVASHKDENDFVTEEKSIVIGYAEEGEVDRPIVLKNVKAVKFIKEQITSGPLGKSKVTLRVARKAGNARCDSNTGFKGVTKGKPYLGKIVMKDGTELSPDFAFGMNSFKAKHNGIELARAALAVDLKKFKPEHWSGLLNTNDEDEINAASEALPSYMYYDEFGEAHSEVQIGVIYYRYTELGDIFKSYRPQSLSHETGRNLFHNENSELFHYLWNNYVNVDMKEALIELQKTLCSSDVFEGDKDLPYYTIATIRKSKLFDLEKDLITSTMVNSHSKTKITTDEFNPNGFFLDFRSNRGPLIRVPSAKILRMFEQELETGAWMYHAMFISLSKIIRACIYGNPQFIFQKLSEKVKRDTLADRYLRDVRGIIFTTDEAAEMNVTALSRPMVPGIAMKQVVDVLLPGNTALIMCKKTYNKALQNCFGEDYELESLKYGFQGFHVRNPSLWRSQCQKVKIWSSDDFRVYLMSKFNISLDRYLLTQENHDVVIFSKDIFAAEHSDADGDHSAVYIPHGSEGQRIMRDFVLSDVCQEELDWTLTYVAKEFSANESLIDEHGKLCKTPYGLYDVPLEDYEENREHVNSYSTYFLQALQAKENIGSATNDGWIFAMILEAYRAYARKNNYEYIDSEDGTVIPMIRLNQEKFFKYHFSYIRGLQDFVVTGVKHNDNGSKDFESLFLRNMAEDSNAKKVRELLQGPLELDAKSASDIIRIVSWAEISGMRLACSGFLKLYNKGTMPYSDKAKEALERLEAFVQSNTYFGKLLLPIYNVIFEYRHSQEIAEQQADDQMVDLLADLGIII